MPLNAGPLTIADDELTWTFARSGGPGGQNVNKVASKAVLRWNLAGSRSAPEEVKARLRTLQRRRLTTEGELVLSSQRFRDQERNRADCLEKLRQLLIEAQARPKPRKATRPSRSAQERRLIAKRRRAVRKAQRRQPAEDER
jgi:ribosome-associated protein